MDINNNVTRQELEEAGWSYNHDTKRWNYTGYPGRTIKLTWNAMLQLLKGAPDTATALDVAPMLYNAIQANAVEKGCPAWHTADLKRREGTPELDIRYMWRGQHPGVLPAEPTGSEEDD